MNQIPIKQNEELQLQRLSAQRELYTSAKKTFYLQVGLNVVVPILLSFCSMFFEPVRPWAALSGVCLVLINLLILERIIKLKREKAAKIQELFDCDVLELPLSPLKSVSEITVEEILEQYHAHSKVQSNVEKIRDWYSVHIGRLPIHMARLICQRTNCTWDKKLRTSFLTIIISIGCLAVIGLGVFGLKNKLTMPDFILIATVLMPFFQFCIRQFWDNRDTINRLKELIKYADSIWKEALNGKESSAISEASRRLQDEIFTHRSRNPLIPDFIYWEKRDEDEKLLNKTAESLIAEYESSQSKPSNN